jgi:GNAT superfamily N-acetyltransferase
MKMNEFTTYRTVDLTYQREDFNPDAPDWARQKQLFEDHGRELRGFPADLDISRYLAMQREGRLVYITARGVGDGLLWGYSSHFWHRDLHFPVRVAQDDAWYVMPEVRNLGIGRRLREAALDELRKAGVKYAYGRLKAAHPHDESMTGLSYVPWETVWIKEL